MNHISSTDEPFLSRADLDQATQSHVQGRWQIVSRKLPISRASAIDDMAARIGIPIPEMIFGDNRVAVRHLPSGWTLSFEAGPALDQVDKTGQGRLQVAYARDWASSREMSAVEGITDVRPFDWSYSTTYKGTEAVSGSVPGAAEPSGVNGAGAAAAADQTESASVSASSSSSSPHLEPVPPAATTTTALPLDLLRRRDPILFHDDVILYESELDDNGISMLRVKVRVMPQRMLLLSRLYMRLDNVVVRVRDTRLYVDFASDQVLREYTAREDAFDSVRRNMTLARGLPPDAVMAALRDADAVAGLLPVVETTMERLDLGGWAARP